MTREAGCLTSAVFLELGLAVFLVSARAQATAVPEEFLRVRDPFKRPALSKSTEEKVTELEKYPTEDFKLVGVLTGPAHIRAMLVDPHGKSHFVSERMRIGVRKGSIVKITADRVIVREQVVNVLGQPESSDIELNLPAESVLVQKSPASAVIVSLPQGGAPQSASQAASAQQMTMPGKQEAPVATPGRGY